jgi:DNA-binding transcriptional MerR regulator
VETYDLAEAAKRSGIGVDELSRLVELGILTPVAGNRFTPGHLRRAGLVIGLTRAGVPVEGLGAAMRCGQVSLDRRSGGAQGRVRCDAPARRVSARLNARTHP